jgi:hypothetical protein
MGTPPNPRAGAIRTSRPGRRPSGALLRPARPLPPAWVHPCPIHSLHGAPRAIQSFSLGCPCSCDGASCTLPLGPVLPGRARGPAAGVDGFLPISALPIHPPFFARDLRPRPSRRLTIFLAASHRLLLRSGDLLFLCPWDSLSTLVSGPAAGTAWSRVPAWPTAVQCPQVPAPGLFVLTAGAGHGGPALEQFLAAATTHRGRRKSRLIPPPLGPGPVGAGPAGLGHPALPQRLVPLAVHPYGALHVCWPWRPHPDPARP